MSMLDTKALHCLNVGRIAKDEALKRYPNNLEFADEMLLLGYVHDIGYEVMNTQADHSYVGGLLLKSQGYKYWKEVYYHGILTMDYHSEALDILNIADLQVNSKGEILPIKERIESINSNLHNRKEVIKNAYTLARNLNLL